ncbi:hypothetical protein Tco_1349406, partial [Tanacetum coccineum]
MIHRQSIYRLETNEDPCKHDLILRPSKQTPYEIWTKKVPNLIYLRVWGCRVVVRLTEPKTKNLGEKGIDCIFIGYVENFKCYRFYVIEPNDYVSVNSIIESRDAMFDEERFTSWIGRVRLHANIARFQRPNGKNIGEGNKKPNVTPTPSVKPNLSGSLGNEKSYRGVLNGDTKTKLVGKISEPSIVLGDECVM